MKKIAILIGLVFAMTGTCMAQDTVFGKYPYYYISWFDEHWDMQLFQHDGIACSIQSRIEVPLRIWNGRLNATFHKEVAVGVIPDSAIHVIGIAVSIYGPHSTLISLRMDTSAYRFADCNFNLYDKSMTLLQSKTVTYRDRDTARYVPGGVQNTNTPYNLHFFQAMYEVFFDTILDLSDTFFISETFTNMDTALYPLINEKIEDHAPTNFELVRIPWELRRYRDNIINGEWIEIDSTYFGHVNANFYPIIRYDSDTCPVVRGIEVIGSGAGQSFLRWQRGEGHLDWQVSYGPVGTAPGDGTIEDYTSPISGYIYYNPDTQYVAYVRARCRFARDEWGPWSTPVTLNTPNGIDDVQLAGMVTLSPNPTSGAVRIEAEGVREVWLVAADGRRTQLQCKDGTVSLKAFAPGLYVLEVQTADGVYKAKVVRE